MPLLSALVLPDRTQLTAQLDALVAELDPTAFVVGVNLHGADVVGRGTRIELLVDADQGIQLEQCAQLNRGLRARLEASPEGAWLADCELTVGSPGIGSALKLPRQFAANVGRDLELTLSSGEVLVASLDAYAEPTLTVSYVARNPTTKKKESFTREIARTDLRKAVVQVSFSEKKLAASAVPLPKPHLRKPTPSNSTAALTSPDYGS